MTTTAVQAKVRPRWATVIAVGLLAAAFGAFVIALGLVIGQPGVLGMGAVALALGAAVSLLGGFAYFIGR